MDLAAMREQYGLAGLDESDLAATPMAQFQEWFDAWASTNPFDANLATVATVGVDGWPESRAVLVKGADERGLVFHTNRNSAKGAAIAASGRAALTFVWREIERQIRVVGEVEHLPDIESDAYFASRPRGAQIGAWASDQSTVLASRSELETQWAEVEARFPGSVPRPAHWGGYLIRPRSMEFWQGRPNRLHDRLRYRRADDGWVIERLAP
ncbi:MAG: pyridoxine/pyridoxamine 5'-phosphate oxidase [Acidimicrobiales bacterium]|nr:MAG: pyridoxine/pyridoxamine 5'-phosphate oxidase [Acidimicrobiales bacterium]